MDASVLLYLSLTLSRLDVYSKSKRYIEAAFSFGVLICSYCLKMLVFVGTSYTCVTSVDILAFNYLFFRSRIDRYGY